VLETARELRPGRQPVERRPQRLLWPLPRLPLWRRLLRLPDEPPPARPPSDFAGFSAPPRPLAASITDEDDYSVSLSGPGMARQPRFAGQSAPATPPKSPPRPAAAPSAFTRREPTLSTPSEAGTTSFKPWRPPTLEQLVEEENLAAAPQRANPSAAPRPEKKSPPPAAAAKPVSPTVRPQASDQTGVMDALRDLRQVVERHLSTVAWSEMSRTQPHKTELLRRMLEVGFSPGLSRELLMDLPEDLLPHEAESWLMREMAPLLLTAQGSEGAGDLIAAGGVYALLGPTGVGKTTTTAKLAARSVLKHGANKVALVTTDSYRIGAHEQLRIYGRILGVSVHLARDQEELAQTLNELSAKHMVLIDTMGASQKNAVVAEQNAMLSACGVKRLLVLQATARSDAQDDVIAAYRGNDELSGVVLTKIDEAVSFAPAIDVLMRHALRLIYVSNGQRVPEDLHLPDAGWLISRAMKNETEQPHRYLAGEAGLALTSAAPAATGSLAGRRHA
jgi:flagellar biosynthesis protein FlhF